MSVAISGNALRDTKGSELSDVTFVGDAVGGVSFGQGALCSVNCSGQQRIHCLSLHKFCPHSHTELLLRRFLCGQFLMPRLNKECQTIAFSLILKNVRRHSFLSGGALLRSGTSYPPQLSNTTLVTASFVVVCPSAQRRILLQPNTRSTVQ